MLKCMSWFNNDAAILTDIRACVQSHKGQNNLSWVASSVLFELFMDTVLTKSTSLKFVLDKTISGAPIASKTVAMLKKKDRSIFIQLIVKD